MTSMFESPILKAIKAERNSISKMAMGIFDNPILNTLQKNGITDRTTAYESPILKAIRVEQNSFTKMAIGIPDYKDIKGMLHNLDITIADDEKEEEDLINETLQVIAEVNPEMKSFINILQLKHYKKATIFVLVWFICNIIPMYHMYNEIFNSDIHYKVNRENVRVRLSPTTIDNSNIITKLHKNTYIEKLDSQDGWTKVRFELDDGIEKEGWIYRTMLTKMD